MTVLAATADGFTLSLAGRDLLRHSRAAPCVFAGVGEERMAMYRGNFDISDYLVERAPLAFVTLDGALQHFRRDAAGPVLLTLELRGDDTAATLLLWAGDQCVDFSRHDGLPSVICGALSSGLLGNAYHHSDIGGYTSLFGNVRTAELLQRWTEMAAFTPVMRTHEGNRPGENLQIDQSPEVLAHFARFTRIWCHLGPYLRGLSEQAAMRGLPLQRPLFLDFPDDPAGFAIQDQYLYGPDLLVAPVHAAGLTNRCAHLPAGTAWTHLWSNTTWRGGTRVTVPAPIGQPPVFFREGSVWEALFRQVADIA